MEVDVQTEIVIERSLAVVSAYAADPDNVPAWYANIKSVEWKTPKPLVVGSQIAFVAHFLGRRMAYTYQVEVFEPGKRLVMRTAEGPFPMATHYTWEATGEGSTLMTLRNADSATGFSKLVVPMMSSAMRRANEADLLKLKGLLETAVLSGS